MADQKDFLRQMIDHTIAGDTDAAKQSFKDFIVPKSMDILGTTKLVVEPEAPVVEPEAPVVEPVVADAPVAEPVVDDAPVETE